MSDTYSIKEIHFQFENNHRDYIVFSTQNPSRIFLYFQHHTQKIRSLFYGEDFLTNIPKLLEKEDLTCIECELGARILGGISLDGNDIVTNKLSMKTSNEILRKLKSWDVKKFKNIKLF